MASFWKRRSWAILATAIASVCIVVMWFVAPPLVEHLSEVFQVRFHGHILGQIQRVEGSVRRLHGPDVTVAPVPLKAPMELRHGDQVQTSIDSRAVLKLTSGDEIEVQPGSAIRLQLWDQKNPASAVYVFVELGQIKSLVKGVRDKAYQVIDGRLARLGTMNENRTPQLTISVLTLADLQPAESDTQTQPIDTQTKSGADAADGTEPSRTAPSSATSIFEPETLSNDYLDEVLVERSSLFQRCWVNRLKARPGLKGQVVVQFLISRRGKVKDPRVVDSELQDTEIEQCVVSVIERTVFRPFKGSEITLAYPIRFE